LLALIESELVNTDVLRTPTRRDELAWFHMMNTLFLDAPLRTTRGQTTQSGPDVPRGYDKAAAYDMFRATVVHITFFSVSDP
jgi:hypothetical protein